MRTIHKSTHTPFTAQQMFDLVNDVGSYPKYLPGCHNTKILERTPLTLKAAIQIKKGGMLQEFTTCNQMEPHQKIEIGLMEGPFKHLKGLWQFKDLPKGGSQVSFHLEFEFSNLLLDIAVGPVLEGIASNFVDAFCQRAYDVYGLPSRS